MISSDLQFTDNRCSVPEKKMPNNSAPICYKGILGANAWASVETDKSYQEGTNLEALYNHFSKSHYHIVEPYRTIISLGSGLGLTDRKFIRKFSLKEQISYIPVDINSYLLKLAKQITSSLPISSCSPIVANFEEDVECVSDALRVNGQSGQRLFLMLGGTFGNIKGTTEQFFGNINQWMKPGDTFILDIGVQGENYDTRNDYSRHPENYFNSLKCFFATAVAQIEGDDSLKRQEISELIDFEDYRDNKLFSGFKLVSKRSKGIVIPIRRYNYEELKNFIRKQLFTINATETVSIQKGVVDRSIIVFTKE